MTRGPGRTEKEKMLAGELYRASDPELTRDHQRAQRLLFELDRIPPSDEAHRVELLTRLLGHLGRGAVVKPGLRCDYGFNVRVGARTFVNYDCVLLDCAGIVIGADVQIAPGVHVYAATHPLDAATRRSGLESALPVTIQDGVWLGGRVVVLPGVTIGANTVVGAGAVVTRDLPPNVLAVGNPCRVVREL